MITIALVLALSMAAAMVTSSRGPAVAFNWIFMPVLLLIPMNGWIDIPALPDLNPRRAILLCIVVAAVLRERGELQLQARSWVDKVVLVGVLVWSASYASNTDFMGFVHRVTSLLMDWWLPYHLARCLWQKWEDLEKAILPIAVSALLVSVLAVYEARLVSRGYARFWDGLLHSGVTPYFEFWRWGYLRAAVAFGHPIILGVVLATLIPLFVLWGRLAPRWKRLSRYAVVACACGSIATISRGPILAVVLGLLSIWFLSKRRRFAVPLLVIACIAMIPYLIDLLRDAMAYIDASLEERGNVESGYYRIALFMIYLDDIRAGGMLGDPSMIGSRYSAAHSIDNAYIFMFLTSGWLGGALFMFLVLTQIVMSLRILKRRVGEERIRNACVAGAVIAISFAMVNVWFAEDYAPVFFMMLALVVNRNLITRLPEDASPRPEARDDEPSRRPRKPAPKYASALAGTPRR